VTAPSDAAAGTYLPIPDADDLVVLLDDQRRPIGPSNA